MARAMRRAQHAPARSPEPDPAYESAGRLGQLGVKLERSMLWTPPGAR